MPVSTNLPARCRAKVRFYDELTAKMRAARFAGREARGPGVGFPSRAYRCPHCHFWHLTSITPGEYRRRRKEHRRRSA